MPPKQPRDGTGELFTRTGLLPTAEALPSAVELTPEDREREKTAHLSAALSYYDMLALDEGFLSMAQKKYWLQGQRKRYGPAKFDKIIQNRAKRRDSNLAAAKDEFIAGYLLDYPGPADDPQQEENLHAQAASAYEAFEKEYRGNGLTRHRKRRAQQELYDLVLNNPQTVSAADVPSQIEPDQVLPTIDLHARNSLARALRPEYFGYTSSDFQDTPDTLVQKVHPVTMRRALVNVGRASHNSVGYLPEGRTRLKRITLTPLEWKKIFFGGPPEAYANGGESAAEAKRKTDMDAAMMLGFSPTNVEDGADAPRRAGWHTIIKKRETMQSYTDNVLIPQLELIHRFQEASDHSGLARLGNEGNMREQLEFFFQFVVGDMLWAVAKVQNYQARRHGQVPVWVPDDEIKAPKAVRKAIFMVNDPQIGRKNFRLLLDVAEIWLQAKLECSQSKDREIDAYLRIQQTPEEYEAYERARLQQIA